MHMPHAHAHVTCELCRIGSQCVSLFTVRLYTQHRASVEHRTMYFRAARRLAGHILHIYRGKAQNHPNTLTGYGYFPWQRHQQQHNKLHNPLQQDRRRWRRPRRPVAARSGIPHTQLGSYNTGWDRPRGRGGRDGAHAEVAPSSYVHVLASG